ncbi:MAG: hypothetical protein KF809_14610, partial [Chloroflexi bacterium]|nr:hypothetical protein [Chloroflexota bacterium]
MRRPRGRWAAYAAATATLALLLVAPGTSAQEPSATEHPIPTTPPGAKATRPPGPWVDPPPAPDGCVPEMEPNDRPEQAGVTVLPPEFCVSGTLEVTSDQDLYFWEVLPEDGLTTWDVSVRGVPTTYTSVHIFPLRSAVGVTPIQRENRDPSRVDSDVWIGTPVPTTGIRLPPGPYLLGISRALAGYKQDMTDDLAYWVDLRRAESALPPTGDSEPNDTVDTAIPVAGAFTLSGDAGDGRDMFRWQIPADSDARAWRIGVEAAAGSSVDLYLRDTDGTTIATADAYYDPDGRAILHDLSLAPGTYFIEIASNVRGEPYTLTTEVVVEPVDLEPNDEREQAVVIDPTTLTATGRLTSDRDVDRFVVDLDAAQVQGLVDVTLDWTDGAKRQLCLYTADDTQIACADSKDRITFPALMLAPGRTQLRVDGARGLDSLYTLTLASAGIPQGPLEVEPNDDIATANPVTGAFLVSGDLTGGSDFFAWTLSEADAARRWHLDLSSTPGNVSRLEFLTADGSLLDELSTSRAGDGRMWDLQLAAGTWMIRVVASSSDAVAYQLRAVESTDTDVDPEPNRRSPVSLDPVTLSAVGRLPTDRDVDMYGLEVTDAMAATLTQVELTWPGEQERRLCMYRSGVINQCATGIGQARLPSLDLTPGAYTLEITGEASTASRYDLRVTAGPARAPDAETEPNDDQAGADDWDPALQMHGTARAREVDVYRVRMPLDVPHRWRLDILGDGLELPQWSQPDGTLAGSPSVSDDGSGAVIDDLVLVSGDHFLEVRALGDYVLTLTDLGAIDPLAETEPNDDAEHAGRLAWDIARHGRLATPTDADVYRFSLAASEHVVITAVPDLTDGGSVAAGGVEL